MCLPCINISLIDLALMYHCLFQKTSLADNVDKVGFRSDPHISSDGYKSKFKPAFMTT